MEFTVKTELDLSGFDKIRKACEALSKPVEVGILHNSEEAQIGALQHYGGTGVYQYGKYAGQEVDIPPRPFLAHAIETYGKDTLNEAAKGLEIKGFDSGTADLILNKVGERLKEATQLTIHEYAAHEHEYPHNSARTIETKGKDSPLIDTGKMLMSIEYEVVK